MPLVLPRRARWPSTGPAAAAPWSSTSATSARSGSRGPVPSRSLQRALTNDLARSGPGRAQYTHLLDDDGSVADDIIVWWLDDERFDVMPNASNTARVRRRPRRRPTPPPSGPSSPSRARRPGPCLGRGRRPRRRRSRRFARAPPSTWQGTPCVAAGTGYTGEDGVECAVPADVAAAVLGGGARAPASRRPVSAPATRCASRPACPCTATSSARASPRCRPGSAGSSAGTRVTFSGPDALERRAGGRAAPAAAGLLADGRQPPRDGVGRPRRRSGRVGHGDERELLADARDGASPWPSSTPPAGLA